VKGRDCSEDLSVDGNNIKIDEGNGVEECGLDSSGLRKRPVTGSCKYGNEPLVLTKSRQFIN
jgi:hypothetical protein